VLPASSAVGRGVVSIEGGASRARGRGSSGAVEGLGWREVCPFAVVASVNRDGADGGEALGELAAQGARVGGAIGGGAGHWFTRW
jgi:hypothetical protein